MSHAEIPCEALCGKQLPCGHQCAQPCAIPCRCECRKTLSNVVLEDMPGAQTPQSSQTTASEAIERAMALQRYHDFANGGAAEEDRRLLEETKKLALEEEQKRRDDQTFEDLFGEGKPGGSKDTGTRTTVKKVPDGNGGWREQRTEYFQPAPPKTSKPKAEEPSLIDL